MCDESLIGISSNSEQKAEIEGRIEEILKESQGWIFKERVCLDYRKVHLQSIVNDLAMPMDLLDPSLRKCILNCLQQFLYEILTDFTMEVRSCIIMFGGPHVTYDFLEEPAGKWMVEQVSNAYIYYNLDLYKEYMGDEFYRFLNKDAVETCIYDLLGEFVQELVNDEKDKMSAMISCFDFCLHNRYSL